MISTPHSIEVCRHNGFKHLGTPFALSSGAELIDVIDRFVSRSCQYAVKTNFSLDEALGRSGRLVFFIRDTAWAWLDAYALGWRADVICDGENSFGVLIFRHEVDRFAFLQKGLLNEY